MSDTKKIKYIFIGKAQDRKELGELSIQSQASWAKDCRTIFENYCGNDVESKIEQRNKVKMKDTSNNYYFLISESNYFYIAVVDSTYPETLVFRLFEDIFKENIPLLRDEKGKLNLIGNNKLRELVNNYQSAVSTNQISAINNEIYEMKDDMKKNVSKVIGNIEDAEKLKEQSGKIADASIKFKNEVRELRKQTCIQNYKWWLIIGLIIAVIIIILLITLLPNSSQSQYNENTNSTNTTIPSNPIGNSGSNRYLIR